VCVCVWGGAIDSGRPHQLNTQRAAALHHRRTDRRTDRHTHTHTHTHTHLATCAVHGDMNQRKVLGLLCVEPIAHCGVSGWWSGGDVVAVTRQMSATTRTRTRARAHAHHTHAHTHVHTHVREHVMQHSTQYSTAQNIQHNSRQHTTAQHNTIQGKARQYTAAPVQPSPAQPSPAQPSATQRVPFSISEMGVPGPASITNSFFGFSSASGGTIRSTAFLRGHRGKPQATDAPT
jgi:hypothetical protein